MIMIKTSEEFIPLNMSVKVGSAPIIKARQFNPNENPGLPGNIFDIATKVTGITILNKNNPTIARYGIFGSKDIRKEEINRAITETLIHPYLSAIIPPKHFPRNTPIVRITSKVKSYFHGRTKASPIRDRIAIDNNMRSTATSKRLGLTFVSFLE
jgi:hypothetical protein